MKMPGRKTLAMGLMLMLVALVGCAAGTAVQEKAERAADTPEALVQKMSPEAIVQKMSPEQRVGQLMMIGILSPTLDKDASWQISRYSMGNVILFDRNMENAAQVRELTADIAKHIKETTGIMPFIAVDQEGGQVLRMRQDFAAVPSEEAIGRTGEPAEAKKWALVTGRGLKDLGINVNFAPAADLGLSVERSYSDSPDMVIAFVKEAVAGYRETGIWSTLKHFPGIGKVKTDPHIDGDSVTLDRTLLEQEDLRPFAELIPQIDQDATFIMVSNVTFTALDPDLPACVSRPIITDLLRNDLGYKGLVISDDMEMGAMAKHYAFGDMGVMAVKAGADMVLVCHDYGHEQETYDGLLREYKNNPEFKKLVDEKVVRIIRVKMKQYA